MIVGILGPGGCGATFLDWTLHYLSGQSSTWQIECDPSNRSNILKQCCVPLADYPLIKRTAHAHAKTHPDSQSIHTVISLFEDRTDFDLHSFYFVDSMQQGRTQTEYNQIIARYPNVRFITYNFTDSDIDIVFCFQHEKIPALVNSVTTLSIWDRRELMSLHYPKEIQGQTTVEVIQQHPNNFVINFSTMLKTLDTSIEDLFQYVGLTLDKTRLDTWKKIYAEWQENNSLNFFDELDTIVQAIVSNTPKDLTKYNMSFAKEVVIASKLLYNHNLALKSYGISNLSENTQQWTTILEPNVYHELNNT